MRPLTSCICRAPMDTNRMRCDECQADIDRVWTQVEQELAEQKYGDDWTPAQGSHQREPIRQRPAWRGPNWEGAA